MVVEVGMVYREETEKMMSREGKYRKALVGKKWGEGGSRRKREMRL